MRRAEGVERVRLQWLLLGESVLFVCTIASLVLDLPVVSSALFAVGFAALPVAVAVAVLRHGLFDVGQVISRAVVFSVLSALLLIAYAVVVGLLGELTAGERRFAVAVTALATLAAAAGWERAQRAVDRLLYGERRDPFAVATRLGDDAGLRRRPRRGAAGAGRRGGPRAAAARGRDRARRSATAVGPLDRGRPAGR